MTVKNSAASQKSLETKFVEVAKNGIERRQRREIQVFRDKQQRRRDAKQTINWLREIEAAEAVPVIRAIAKAEKVGGHRLVVRIDDDLMLCSRGFRIATSRVPTPGSPLVAFTTFRLNDDSMRLGWRLVAEGEGVKNRIKLFLTRPGIESRLLYQGVDEWPTIGKICWWGAVIGFCWCPWPFLFSFLQKSAYERAFRPAGS